MKQRIRLIMWLLLGRRVAAIYSDQRAIGINASTHCYSCSCRMDQAFFKLNVGFTGS